MTGAGLKKWSPHTRSGRLVTIASSMIGSVDVLLARIVAGRADPVELGEEILLGGEVFDDGFQHEVARRELVEIGDGAHACGDVFGGRRPRACRARPGG